MNEEEHLPAKKAAAVLNVHLNTFYRYCRLGLIPVKKVGGRWHIDAERLEKYLEEEEKEEEVS